MTDVSVDRRTPSCNLFRYAGLRQTQTLSINARDLREADGPLWLTVAVGKTEEEAAEAREIPLAPELGVILRDRIRAARESESGWLFPSPHDSSSPRGRDSEGLREVFDAATSEGEIRRIVWDPPNRKARTSHAFRSAILVGLRGLGVEQGPRLAYVGHSEGTTEVSAYVNLSDFYRPDWSEMVRKMPVIDWTGPKGSGNVIRLDTAAAV